MLTTLRQKLLWRILPVFLLLLLSQQLLLAQANLKSVRIEEIPFSGSGRDHQLQQTSAIKSVHERGGADGIHAISQLEDSRRGFFHIFNVPYIVCFFAAKGKWPYIPSFMQVRVDSVAKSIFTHNDTYIRQFCRKWIQIKECFRPIFGPTPNPELDAIARLRLSTPCTCTNQNPDQSVVYFDKNYVGNVSSETILNTIEFLESFLPPPTKKTKKKNRVRSRLGEMEIE